MDVAGLLGQLGVLRAPTTITDTETLGRHGSHCAESGTQLRPAGAGAAADSGPVDRHPDASSRSCLRGNEPSVKVCWHGSDVYAFLSGAA